MPIYEYRCEKCGEFERTQRITEPALDRCPTCRRKVRRLISNTSFQLKGGGWYVTDYARAGKAGSPTGSQSEAGKDGGNDSGKDSDKAASKTSDATADSPSKPAGKPVEKKAETKPASSKTASADA